MDSNSTKERVLAYKSAAEEQVKLIRTACPLTKEFFQEHLLIYTRLKFMLDEHECADSDRFIDLITTSLAKSMNVGGEMVSKLDTAASCDGTPTAVVKKVLLFMAVQKDFNVLLPPERTGVIRTVPQLGDLVYELYTQKQPVK